MKFTYYTHAEAEWADCGHETEAFPPSVHNPIGVATDRDEHAVVAQLLEEYSGYFIEEDLPYESQEIFQVTVYDIHETYVNNDIAHCGAWPAPLGEPLNSLFFTGDQSRAEATNLLVENQFESPHDAFTNYRFLMPTHGCEDCGQTNLHISHGVSDSLPTNSLKDQMIGANSAAAAQEQLAPAGDYIETEAFQKQGIGPLKECRQGVTPTYIPLHASFPAYSIAYFTFILRISVTNNHT